MKPLLEFSKEAIYKLEIKKGEMGVKGDWAQLTQQFKKDLVKNDVVYKFVGFVVLGSPPHRKFLDLIQIREMDIRFREVPISGKAKSLLAVYGPISIWEELHSLLR